MAFAASSVHRRLAAARGALMASTSRLGRIINVTGSMEGWSRLAFLICCLNVSAGSTLCMRNDRPSQILLMRYSYHQDVTPWAFGKIGALREAAMAVERKYRYYYMGRYV